MAFNDDTLSKSAFKTLQGKAHTGNSKDLPNETESTAPTLGAQEVFAKNLPFDPNDAMSQELARFISLDLVLDPSSNGKAYDGYLTTVAGTDLDGYVNPRTGVNYADGDRVGFFIPPKFDAQTDPPPVNSYRAILKDNGSEVAPSDATNWYFDYRAGIIVSETDLSLGSTGTVDGYVYVGTFVDEDLTTLLAGGGAWSTSGSDTIHQNSGNVLPGVDGTESVGNINFPTSLRWKDGYFKESINIINEDNLHPTIRLTESASSPTFGSFIRYSSVANFLELGVNNNFTPTTDLPVIRIPRGPVGLGNVGIGETISPSLFKLQVDGDIGPNTDLAYSLGSTTRRWLDGYFGPTGIFLGDYSADSGQGAVNFTTTNDNQTGISLFLDNTTANGYTFPTIDWYGNDNSFSNVFGLKGQIALKTDSSFGQSNTMTFSVDDTGTLGVDIMTIDAAAADAGVVGVNTSKSGSALTDAALHAVGDTSSSPTRAGLFEVSTATTNGLIDILGIHAHCTASSVDSFGPALRFELEDSSASHSVVGRIGVERDNNTDNYGSMVFQTAAGSSPTTKMFLRYDGRLGIGEVAPDRHLHVSAPAAEGPTGAFIRLTNKDTVMTTGDVVGTIEFETLDSTDAGVAAMIELKMTDANANADLLFYSGGATDLNAKMALGDSADSGVSIVAHDGSDPFTQSGISLALGTNAGTNGSRGRLQVNHNAIPATDEQGLITMDEYTGTEQHLWVDDTGDLRIWTTIPTASTDTSGTVVGTQSFTGMHFYPSQAIVDSDNDDGQIGYLAIGDAVRLVDGYVIRSTSASQKDVVGIFCGFTNSYRGSLDNSTTKPAEYWNGHDGYHSDPDAGDPLHSAEITVWHAAIASLGDARDFSIGDGTLLGFNVCDENGAISSGDLLCSSSTPGYLMKQSDDIIRSSTVGKALEDASFDGNGQATGIYGYLYCG